MPDINSIPSEFRYTVFTKVIQEIMVDTNDYAKKNIFPEMSQPGQELRANVYNPTRRIIKDGIKPLNSKAHFNPHERPFAVTVPMINYILSDYFDMNDFVFQSSETGVNKQIIVANFINRVMSEKKINMENTLEWILWDLLLSGKFNYNNIEYDYDPDSTQYFTLADSGASNPWDYKWNSQANADVMATINYVYEIVKGLGGGKIEEAIACKATWDTAMRSTKLNNVYSDSRKDAFITGEYAAPIAGVTPIIMDNDYQLETGSTVYNYIPEGKVIFKIKGTLGNLVVGDSYVPNNNDQIVTQRGRYAYPIIKKDPVGVLNVTGLTFLPQLVNKYSYAVVTVYS